nr:type II toxin-antitoxin system VapC family toxin [uncultured Rhodopila sp.]
MKLLLDTHALIWWLSDDDRIGPQARALIADPGNDVLVSVVSLWEIVVKVRVGKLDSDIREVIGACDKGGFTSLDVRPHHLKLLATLPTHHRDPFDHLLIAQAIAEDATFVTDDRHAGRYPVRAVPCE